MQPRLLTRKAFSVFYGSNRVVLLDPSLARKELPAFDGVDFLFLGAEGKLYLPGEIKEATTEDTLEPVGAPAGVLGIIGRKQLEDQIVHWSNWFEHQTGRAAPRSYLISGWRATSELYKMIAQCLAEDASRSRSSAAETEKDLAYLRRDFEQALINLEKARRLIHGVGFDTRFTTLSLPLGKKTVCPLPGEERSLFAPYRKSYGLPVDAAGIIGLSLHCQMAEGALATGHFSVGIYRFADNLCLGRATIAFEEMHPGWFYLELEQVMQRSFGDAYLVLEWAPANDGVVPAITLSTLMAETRQGGELAEHEIPALQVWSGFAPGELSNEDSFSPANAYRRSASFRKLVGLGSLLTGSNSAATVEVGKDWLQTHLVPGPIGIKFDALLPSSVSQIEVRCETAHVSGPECCYLIAATRKNVELCVDDFAQMLSTAKNSGSQAEVDEKHGLAWCYSMVPANRIETLRLSLPSGFAAEDGCNLYVAVVSATGKQDYGWCRWYDVAVSVPMEAIGTVSGRLKTTDTEVSQRMRSLKFPEFADQLEFLAGTSKLQELSSKLGFSPMIIAEDNGSLQTHPLLEGVSAVVYRDAVLPGVTRVACEVETAHDRAPDFRYVMALLPAKITDKNDVFVDFLDRALPTDTKMAQGMDDVSGLIYSTKLLSALEVSTISIDFDQPLSDTHDLIVAVLPTQENISYGWCRWMSLSISSVMASQQEYRLLNETGQG